MFIFNSFLYVYQRLPPHWRMVWGRPPIRQWMPSPSMFCVCSTDLIFLDCWNVPTVRWFKWYTDHGLPICLYRWLLKENSVSSIGWFLSSCQILFDIFHHPLVSTPSSGVGECPITVQEVWKITNQDASNCHQPYLCSIQAFWPLVSQMLKRNPQALLVLPFWGCFSISTINVLCV